MQGRLASFQVGGVANDPNLVSAQTIQIQTDALPLEMFRWAVARAVGDLEITGNLQANGKLVNRTDGSRLVQDFQGEVGVQNLFVQGAFLKGDQLRLQQIRIPCDLTASAEQIEVRQLKIDSELGQVSVRGVLPLQQPVQGGDGLHWLRNNFQVDSTVNIAALAQQMPNYLSINPQTKLTGGQIVANLSSQRVGETTNWNAKLQTANIAAVNNGQPISLKTPIQLEVIAKDTVSGPLIEKITGSSQFMSIAGQGTVDQAQIVANCSLDELASELGQFLDLSAFQPAEKRSCNWIGKKQRKVLSLQNWSVVLISFS